MTRASRASLLVPRTRPDRPADFAARDVVIARQGHGARRVRRARRIVRILACLVCLALGFVATAAATRAAADWLSTTALLAVTRVEVVGTQRIERAAILRAARIEGGANILALDPAAIRERVELLPGVREARVVRQLPHQVVLVVEERRPYALVNGQAGLVWIDAQGYLVARERRPWLPMLPILSGVEPPARGADGLLPDRLRVGLSLLRAVERTGGGLAARISEIDLASPEGPVLYTVDRVAVRVGEESWDERLARLDGVLAEFDARGEGVEWIDLRFRDLVVLQPEPAVAEASGDATPGHEASTVNRVERQ